MKKHPHILKFCSDQHSPKVCGYAGDEHILTPNLDRLAANGVSFENHYAANPVCIPGRYSMITGQLPRELGTLHFTDILPSEPATYMSHFSDHGYQTTCIGKMHFHGQDQMHGWMFRPFGDMENAPFIKSRGYTIDKDVCKGKPGRKFPNVTGCSTEDSIRTARPGMDCFIQFDESVTREAVINLKDYFRGLIANLYQEDRPILYEVSYKTPHCPFVAPPEYFHYYRERIGLPEKKPASELPPYLQRSLLDWEANGITQDMVLNARAGYWGLVQYMDTQIGIVMQVLDELGLRDDFLIMYSSDHGELAGEHGLWQKTNFYEESARIPMIIAGGELPKGAVVRHNTSHLDLFPTLCDMANLPSPEGIRGRSMLPLIESHDDNAIIYSEIFAPTRAVMAKHKNIKLCDYDGAQQLFDLEKDPEELSNLINHPDYQSTRKRLQEAIDALPDPVELP